MKETTAVSLGERIDDQIPKFTLSEIQMGKDIVNIKHNMIFSMIDGKVCNAITETTSTKCYICGVTCYIYPILVWLYPLNSISS